MTSTQKFTPVLIFSLLLLGLYGLASQPTHAAAEITQTTSVLYDASSGSIPAAANMPFISVLPGAATQVYASGATTFDSTSAGNSTYAGYPIEPGSVAIMPTLDRQLGFQIDLTFQMISESHANSNRSGWSLIAIADDKMGIELAFWEGEIWAQHDDLTGSLFTHGEGAAYDTATGLVDYSLIVLGDEYTVTANSSAILSGPVRYYSNFTGTIDPYETPNFVFLGDDTTSALAEARFNYLAVITPDSPTPSPTATVSPSATHTATTTATITVTPGGPTATPATHLYLPMVQGPDTILRHSMGL